MFWIRCAKGKQITGDNMSWDEARKEASSAGGIIEIGLHDGEKVVQRIGLNAESYHYHAEAIGGISNRVTPDGATVTSDIPPRKTYEEVAAFYPPSYYMDKYDLALERVTARMRAIEERLAEIKATKGEIDLAKANIEIVALRSERQSLKLDLMRIGSQCLDALKAGGTIVSYRLDLRPSKYNIGDEPSNGSTCLSQPDKTWFGQAPKKVLA